MAIALGACPLSPSGIPEPDSCLDPGAAEIDTLELGSATLESLFEPWQDGDQIAMVIGGQGGAMFALRFRIQGAIDNCVRQRTTVDDGSVELLADDTESIKVYEQEDGSYVTNDYWVILNGPMPDTGAEIVVETSIEGVSENRSLRVR